MGMPLDVNDINAMEHVSRTCSKATDAVNIIRTIGFNGSGFATKVKRRLYETFTRPRLEYGLQLIQPQGKVLKLLEYSGIHSMLQRCHELNGTWDLRTSRLGKGFMVREARIAARRRDCRRLPFKIGAKNRLLIRYHDQTVWAGRKVEDEEWRGIFQGIRDKGRRLEHEREAKEPILQRRSVTSSIMDQHRSRAIRKRLLLWILRKLIGQPKACTNCLNAPGTYVDSAIGTGQWLEAANLIADIEEKCLGRNVKKLRRELGEETWIVDRGSWIVDSG